MHKGFLKTTALLGALAVALGAFGAHGLRQNFDENAVNIFETAVRYHFYHVFALLGAGMLFKDFHTGAVRLAGYSFITGIILFCGSLYILSLITGSGIPGYTWVGAITPFGGLLFIVGWVSLFIGVLKKN